MQRMKPTIVLAFFVLIASGSAKPPKNYRDLPEYQYLVEYEKTGEYFPLCISSVFNIVKFHTYPSLQISMNL